MNPKWQNVDEIAIMLADSGMAAYDAWDEACWVFDMACMVMQRPIALSMARETIKKEIPDWSADTFGRLMDLAASYAEHVEPEPEPRNPWSLDPRAD
jgi:hypothetical protein